MTMNPLKLPLGLLRMTVSTAGSALGIAGKLLFWTSAIAALVTPTAQALDSKYQFSSSDTNPYGCQRLAERCEVSIPKQLCSFGGNVNMVASEGVEVSIGCFKEAGLFGADTHGKELHVDGVPTVCTNPFAKLDL